eukprot:TRINITY_DN2852_c0_g1_i1.p1 TRINITY_DN2852_c0_g1~~TRINITY_DN2852_c0_g1_i1.p1  ORF type:complete len:1047 (-),score=208.56 TRINITY_DN2852_c0_g1_i1:730-3870(-)
MSRLDLDCNKIKNNIENADVRSDYKLKEELGSGAYGVVRKAVHKKTKEEVAVKIVNKSKSLTNYRQQQQLETEISILTRAQHPNIISLKHVYQTSNRIFIVMTLVKGGELFDQLMKNGSFAEKDAAFISREILKGIEYLHTIDIVHRDLKPQNILCDVDSNQNITAIYITDFGLSKIVPQNPVMNSLVGTPHYIAPETITGGGYTKAVDLWAVGCIIYNLLSSMYPFSGDTPSEIFSNVSSYRVDFNDECFESVSQAAKDLISSLLTHWKTRLSAKEALNHPWFKHTQALSCDKVIKTDRLGVLKDAIQPLILAPPNPEPHDQLYLVEESSYNHWDDEDWTKFLEIATLLQVPKGQLIQHECESITEYGIIKEGSVRLERILSEEHKTLLATLGPKDALGTFGLAQYLRRTLTNSDSPKHRPQLQHQTSSNTLRNSSGNVVSPSASLYSTAETDVQLYVVPYDKLLDLVYSSPSLSFKFWKRLAGEFCRWYSQFCSRAKDEERKPVPVPETYGNTLTAGKKTKKPKKRSGITLPNSENMWHGERILAKLKSKWHMRGPSAPTLLDHVAGARSSIIVTKRSLILLASVFTLKFEARIPIECISELKITAENNLSNITNNQNQIQTQNNSPPLQSSSHGPPSPGIQSSASLLNVSRNQLPTHNASGIPMLSTTTTLSTLRSSSPSLSAMGHNNTGTIHTFVPPELSSTSAPQLCNQLSNLNSSKTLKLYYKKGQNFIPYFTVKANRTRQHSRLSVMLSVRSHLQGLDHDHNENRGLSSLRVSSSTTAPVWTPQSYQPSNLRFSHVDFVEDSQNDEAFVGLRKEDTAPKTDHNTSSLQLSVQTEGLRASCIIPAAEESLTRMMDLMDARREGNPLTESGAQRLESYVGNLQELRKNLKTLIENNLDNTKVLSSLLTVHDKIHDTLEAYGLLDEEEEEKEVHSTDLGQLVLFFWQLLQFLLRLCYWIAQHLWSKKTTTRSPNAKERTSEKEEQEEQVEEVCQICYGPSKLLTLPCRHSYCSECLEHYIEEEVNNGRVNICVCISVFCGNG